MDSINRLAIGIDVSDRTACVCVTDRSGVLDEFRIALDEEAIRTRIPFVAPETGVAVLETGPRSAWLKRVLVRLGMRVVVADARKLASVTNSPTKTDRNDARMLARLGLADELMNCDTRLLCDTYVRPPELQAVYDRLVARDLVVRRRGDFVRLVRSIVKGAGFTLRGRATSFPEQLAQMPAELLVVIEPLLVLVSACDSSLRDMDHGLEAIAKSDPVARRLQTVKGVGPIIALAFRCVIGEPGRFSNIRNVGAYLGMVPRRDQSGRVDPSLGISKCGNSFMRRLLVQGASHILGPFGMDCALRRWGLDRLAAKGDHARKKVRVAVGRKLAVQLLSIWKNEKEWVPFPAGPPDDHPSATDGGADCVLPLDASELAHGEIAAAPTAPTQPCARPNGVRTDESAERRRERATAGRSGPATIQTTRYSRPRDASAEGERGCPPPGARVAPAPGLVAPARPPAHMDAPQEKTGARATAIPVGPQPPPARGRARARKDLSPSVDEGAAS